MKGITSFISWLWSVITNLFGKKKASVTPDLHRKLGDTEKYYHYACEKACTIVSAVFFISAHKQITEDHVRQCMQWLMDMHPMLRMCIVDYKGKHKFMEKMIKLD